MIDYVPEATIVPFILMILMVMPVSMVVNILDYLMWQMISHNFPSISIIVSN